MTDTTSLQPIRRVVTANDDQGLSYFSEDGASPAIKYVAERPGYRITNLWRTEHSPALTNAPDTINAHVGVAPPQGGTVLRILDMPPEPNDPLELEKALNATFSKMYGDAHRDVQAHEHPGMHRTESVDYALMLEGELVAILDKEETILRAGDVLIQRGTRHAWANRSGKSARIAFILVSGHSKTAE